MLGIRQDSYWRIELPRASDEDRKAAKELKTILPQILQYEVTQCPFKRGFHVELPESPQIIKLPWKPKHSPISPTPHTPSPRVALTRSSSLRDIAEPSIVTPTEEGVFDFSDDAVYPKVVKSEDADNGSDSHPSPEVRSERVPPMVAALEERKASLKGSPAMERSPSQRLSQRRRHHSLTHSLDQSPDICEPVLESQSDNLIENLSPNEQPDLQNESQSAAGEESVDPNLQHHELMSHETLISGDARSGKEVVPLDAIPSAKNETNEREQTPNEIDVTGFRWIDELDDRDDVITPAPPEPNAELHSATMPSQLQTVPVSKEIFSTTVERIPTDPETNSIASSADSFQSFHNSTSPQTPSPPYSDSTSPNSHVKENHLKISRTRPLRRDDSEFTVTLESLDHSVNNSKEPEPEHSTSDVLQHSHRSLSATSSDSFSSFAPSANATARRPSPSAALRHRLSRRRAHSPLPSPTNIYTPTARDSSHHLTSAILQKTCSLLLGPPAQLVALMLNLASRITNGSLKGDAFTYNENGHPIPCSWDSGEEDGSRSDDWEDDYGISLYGIPERKRSHGSKEAEVSASWELD